MIIADYIYFRNYRDSLLLFIESEIDTLLAKDYIRLKKEIEYVEKHLLEKNYKIKYE